MSPEEYADSRLLLCHDIYHLVMDFPMNPMGEVGLHAALFAQNRYPRAILVIAGVLLTQENNN
jgi:ubiquinone biosynthesis protein Coq4